MYLALRVYYSTDLNNALQRYDQHIITIRAPCGGKKKENAWPNHLFCIFCKPRQPLIARLSPQSMTWDECKVYKNGEGVQYVQQCARRSIRMQTQQCSVTIFSQGRTIEKLWAKYRRIYSKYGQNSVQLRTVLLRLILMIVRAASGSILSTILLEWSIFLNLWLVLHLNGRYFIKKSLRMVV